MKRLLFLLLLVILALSACMPPPLTLVPPETLAAQTLAAIPKTDTPTVTATPPPSATATVPSGPATPELDLNIAGAYCLPTNTPRTKGLVTKVMSGDTIEVLITNQTYKVRYIGVHSPSVFAPAEWQGAQAVSVNQSLVEGKYVTLVQDATDLDAQGYYPRYVLIDHIFVNYEVIRQGYGTAVSSPPDIACDNSLIAAQVEAQNAIRGIWMATPVPTFTITPTPTITLTPTKTRFPTATRSGICNCLGPKLTCNRFRTQAQAQACFDYCRRQGYGDIFGLDKNGNGLACEGTLKDLFVLP